MGIKATIQLMDCMVNFELMPDGSNNEASSIYIRINTTAVTKLLK